MEYKEGDKVVFEHWGNHGIILGTVSFFDGYSIKVVPDKIIDNVKEYNLDITVKFIPLEIFTSPLFRAMREIEDV